MCESLESYGDLTLATEDIPDVPGTTKQEL